MSLSLEERKRRLIENACATCGGGEDTGEPGGADGSEMDQEPDLKLMNTLSKLKKPKRKKNGT